MITHNVVSQELVEVMCFARNAPTFVIDGKTADERRLQMMHAMLDDEDTEGPVSETHCYHIG